MGLQQAASDYIFESYQMQCKNNGEHIADRFMEISDLLDKAKALPRTEFYHYFEPLFEEQGILYIIGRDSKQILATGGLTTIAAKHELDDSRLRFKIYYDDRKNLAIIYARNQKEGLHNTSMQLGPQEIAQMTNKFGLSEYKNYSQN